MKKASTKRDRTKLMALLEHSEVRSWRAMMHAFNTVFSKLEHGLMAEGCSVSRFQILFYLYFEGDLPAVEIARKLVVTRGNISMFLRRMEGDELITKILPAGQKRPLLRLSPKGERLFETIFPSHIARVRKIAPRLPSSVINILSKV